MSRVKPSKDIPNIKNNFRNILNHLLSYMLLNIKLNALGYLFKASNTKLSILTSNLKRVRSTLR